MSVQPGWYVDPADPETQRYWDGDGWVGAPIPADATPPPGPPPAESPTAPTAGRPAVGPSASGSAAPAAISTSGPSPVVPTAPYPPAGPGYGYGPPPGWPSGGYPVQPPEPRPHGMALAGYGSRFLARLIDFGIVFALNSVVNGWFVWRFLQEMSPVWREFWARVSTGSTSTAPLPQPGDQAGGLQVAILLIAAALWFAYEVPAMASGGQTVGKRVMGIRAVPVTADQPLGFGRSFRRWNTLGLPTLLWYCCGFGLLLQLIDCLSPLFDHPLRQALHDKRAQTVVVQVPRTTPTPVDPHDRARPRGDSA